MGNYVQSHLTKEEHVVFEAHYNWCIWLLPIIGFIFFSIPLFFVLRYAPSDEVADSMGFPVVMFLIGLWILIYTYIRTQTDEFAITIVRYNLR